MKKIANIMICCVIVGNGMILGCGFNGNGAKDNSLYLLKAEGHLRVNFAAQRDPFEVYFHVPIAFKEQIPLLLQIECPELIEYRFIKLTPPNILVAARLKGRKSSVIHWTGWVIVKSNNYSDKPLSAFVPDSQDFTEYEKKWLVSTDCAQLSAPVVQDKAASVNTSKNLMQIANNITNLCKNIPWTFAHSPMAFDAVYTLNYGNSCTGHAHAGAALFRANGIPARSILNIPAWYEDKMDMHWIIDYYVPGYGWINMETSLGTNFYNPAETVVLFVSNPEDEYPLFFTVGVDAYWYSSDPALGVFNPDWGQAHISQKLEELNVAPENLQMVFDITGKVFDKYTQLWGIDLTPEYKNIVLKGYAKQIEALFDMQNGTIGAIIQDLQQALEYYNSVDVPLIKTIFFDDFEKGKWGWTHGGDNDEWQLGYPAGDDFQPHSGSCCWGTDLNGTYERGADCWLMSETIQLRDLASANLSFWVLNRVADSYGDIYDYLWLEISKNGNDFVPLCCKMGGGNDDPHIPEVAGWSRLVLDLGKYLNSQIKFRFRFTTNESVSFPTQAGSFIDDVHIYGRKTESIHNQVKLDLQLSKFEERAWLMKKTVAKVEVIINNPHHLKINELCLYSIDNQGSLQLLEDVHVLDQSSTVHVFENKVYLKEGTEHFFVVARGEDGSALSVSSPQVLSFQSDD